MRYSILLLAILPARADVSVNALFADHMVLQRNAPVRIWGRAAAGENVTVSFNGQTKSATPSGGRWELWLNPMPAGGPFDLAITGANTIAIHDVLIGDVWVAGGQSNMGLTLGRTDNAARDVPEAKHDKIRFFLMPQNIQDQPIADPKGAWKECTPDNAKSFSAVAYFFVRDINRSAGVPIGVLQNAIGGTPAEGWTSIESLKAEPKFLGIFEYWARALVDYPENYKKYEARVAVWETEKKGVRPQPPQGPGHRNQPAGLFNGMVAPLAPYAIKGAIWYQGENNSGRNQGDIYKLLFETMIGDWRRVWGQGNFPFLWVQLPNFITKGTWSEVQQAQLDALELRNTGMAVTIDVGDPKDIHPTNKLDPGTRLARVARAQVYGEKIECCGPLFRQVTRDGAALRVWFNHAAGLRTKDGGPVMAFEVAGADGKFVAADAKIDGETVVVSNATVPRPAAVRYAWGGNPATNLYNGEKLPASPFRAAAR